MAPSKVPVAPTHLRCRGVLQRAGHTEAAVDLVRLAGCRPIGVICEIMSESGEMARLPELLKFARKDRLKICTIEGCVGRGTAMLRATSRSRLQRLGNAGRFPVSPNTG